MHALFKNHNEWLRTAMLSAALITLAAFIPEILPAQGTEITFAYGYNNGHQGNRVRQLHDGGYVVIGGEDGFAIDGGFPLVDSADIFLMRTDEYSAVVWQKTFGTDSTRDHGLWLEVTPDSGYILVGSSSFDKNTGMMNAMDSVDIIVMKTDADGNQQWGKRFDSGGDDRGWSVILTQDGGYLVSGFADLSPFSLAGPPVRAWLIKLNAAGVVEWEAKYEYAIRDFDTGEPFIYTTKQTYDKGFIIVGTTWSNHQADLYVMKLDSVGNVEWAKSYDHVGLENNFSGAYDVLQSFADSTFVITGFMDKNRNALPQELNYPYVLHLNDTGLVISQHYYDYMSFRDRTGFSSVFQNPDSSFVFCGKAGYGGSGEEIVMMKTDKDINFLWGRHFEFGGAFLGGVRDIRGTRDGGYIMTGIFSFGPVNLIKMDQDGQIACNTPTPIFDSIPTITTVFWNPDTVQGYSEFAWMPPPDNYTEDTTAICVLSNPLPVQMGTFEAQLIKDSEVLLNWETAREWDNDYFGVERSTNGTDFHPLGKVPGAGTSKDAHAYHFTDTEPGTGRLYYRLRQVDFNGGVSFSEIKTVLLMPSGLWLENVFADREEMKIVVNLVSEMPGNPVRIRLTDLQGRNLYARETRMQLGENRVEIPAGGFAHGIYLLTVSNGKGLAETRKVLY